MNYLLIPGLLLAGWAAGLIINYLSDVLPETRRLTRDVCTVCKQAYSLRDFFFIRSCSTCNQKRSVRTWIVQILVLASTVLIGLVPLGRLGFGFEMVLLLYFGVVATIDIEHRIIMHPVSLVGAGIGLVIGFTQHSWQSTLLGGLAGFGIMIAVYFLGGVFAKWLARLRKMETDEEAFGFGDVALSTVLGLLLGWPGVIGGLVLAIFLGGAGSLIVIIYALFTKKYHAFMAVPYGPFLILSAVILLLRVPLY